MHLIECMESLRESMVYEARTDSTRSNLICRGRQRFVACPNDSRAQPTYERWPGRNGQTGSTRKGYECIGTTGKALLVYCLF